MYPFVESQLYKKVIEKKEKERKKGLSYIAHILKRTSQVFLACIV